jgi:hypothetical protein
VDEVKGFEVFTAVEVLILILWIHAPYNTGGINQHFVGSFA